MKKSFSKFLFRTNQQKSLKQLSFQNSVVVFLFRWMLRGSSSCLRSLLTSSSSFISSSSSSPSKTACTAFASGARGGLRTEGTHFIPSRRHHLNPSLNNRFSPSLGLSSLSPHRRTRRPTPARGTKGLFFASLPPVGPQLASFSAAASSSLSVFSSTTTNMVSVAWIVGAASIVDFGIQLVGWAISSAMKTEKYYDLCGSGAFAAVAVSTFACTNGEPRPALATTAGMTTSLRWLAHPRLRRRPR